MDNGKIIEAELRLIRKFIFRGKNKKRDHKGRVSFVVVACP